MTAPSDQDEWSQEDILTLTEAMKTTLPANDDKLYKISVSHLDWDKVAFKNYTGPMCRQKWSKISNQIRKVRTLTELMVDAEEFVMNPYKGKRIQNHPDYPKKPIKPYLRFFLENKAQYKESDPDMRYGELDKMLTLIYKELPEEKKNKYIEDYAKERQEFDRNLEKFRKEHPDLIQSTQKSKIPGTPKANVPPTPKANVPETPEADVPETPEVDVPETPEVDVPETPEADDPETPEADEQQESKLATSAKQKSTNSAKKRKNVTLSKTTEAHRIMKRSKQLAL